MILGGGSMDALPRRPTILRFGRGSVVRGAGPAKKAAGGAGKTEEPAPGPAKKKRSRALLIGGIAGGAFVLFLLFRRRKSPLGGTPGAGA